VEQAPRVAIEDAGRSRGELIVQGAAKPADPLTPTPKSPEATTATPADTSATKPGFKFDAPVPDPDLTFDCTMGGGGYSAAFSPLLPG